MIPTLKFMYGIIILFFLSFAAMNINGKSYFYILLKFQYLLYKIFFPILIIFFLLIIQQLVIVMMMEIAQ